MKSERSCPVEDLKKLIRDVPDFPKEGIIFKDITTLLKDGAQFRKSVDALAEHYNPEEIDLVLGIEARGFIFGAALAYKWAKPFIIVRKPGKLPAEIENEEYELEYGTDAIEIHRDAISKDQRVLIVDDLLATGGTVAAVTRLVEKLGGKVSGIAFLIELGFLKGKELLSKYDVFSLLRYQ
ncbi:adenine phosphoribosyltransferase [candidate division KSB1 bacterium]|nr:adenine phosphoribosyltransferase [candidate division KSB1 bacterium]